ncbi:hypothetical protein BDV32DRAFT_50930 [Aspergillus pseudonomiae]|nr:hypothetical protein BDV32DRAFT_50930 [Aspergillus pseudonomiae]
MVFLGVGPQQLRDLSWVPCLKNGRCFRWRDKTTTDGPEGTPSISPGRSWEKYWTDPVGFATVTVSGLAHVSEWRLAVTSLRRSMKNLTHFLTDQCILSMPSLFQSLRLPMIIMTFLARLRAMLSRFASAKKPALATFCEGLVIRNTTIGASWP